MVLTPPTQLHSLGGLTGLMEQTRKRFGDAVGFRLVVYPTYAILDRPDPSDGRRVLAYDYRGGWGDPTSSPKSAADGPVAVDLSKFDIAATVGLMARCPGNPAHEAVRRPNHVSDRRARHRPHDARSFVVVGVCLVRLRWWLYRLRRDGTPKRLDLPT